MPFADPAASVRLSSFAITAGGLPAPLSSTSRASSSSVHLRNLDISTEASLCFFSRGEHMPSGKLGHCDFQTRPLRVETGQYPPTDRNGPRKPELLVNEAGGKSGVPTAIGIGRHDPIFPPLNRPVCYSGALGGRGPRWPCVTTPNSLGPRGMDWPDYLRDQAAMYRKLAEEADDPVVKAELLELASVCEEVANNIEDHLTGG